MRDTRLGCVERQAFALGAQSTNLVRQHLAPGTAKFRAEVQRRLELLEFEPKQCAVAHRNGITGVVRHINASFRDESPAAAVQHDLVTTWSTPEQMDLS